MPFRILSISEPPARLSTTSCKCSGTETCSVQFSCGLSSCNLSASPCFVSEDRRALGRTDQPASPWQSLALWADLGRPQWLPNSELLHPSQFVSAPIKGAELGEWGAGFRERTFSQLWARKLAAALPKCCGRKHPPAGRTAEAALTTEGD